MKAVITGASSGIGRDMARVLGSRGWDLILVARRQDRLVELQRELTGKFPIKVRVLPLDLAKKEACFELYRQVKPERVDALINNAGFGLFGPFETTDLDKELELINVNIRAVHILTKLFYQDFCRRDHGRILNVASSAAFLPGPLLSSYYASKAYVLRLTQALREELRRAGRHVTVSAFCPGPVKTEFDRVADVRFSVEGLSSQRAALAAVDGMLKGKLVIVPGLLMKLTRFGVRFAPDAVQLRGCWHMQSRKQPPVHAKEEKVVPFPADKQGGTSR